MTFYYAVAYDGKEIALGTSDRGFIDRYKSLRAAKRYFFDSYARWIYAKAVDNMDMRDIELRVYIVHSAVNNGQDTLVYTYKI